MLINVSPHFKLNTITGIVTERVSPNGNIKRKHNFHDAALPLPIFRDRMTGWFFEPAMKLLSVDQDIAAVHIVTPLIEALGQRYQGESSQGRSREVFEMMAKEIFGIDDVTATLIYKGLRCGFAHHGFIKDQKDRNRIVFTGGLQQAMEYDDSRLLIDSWQYVDQVHGAYEEYYSKLQEDAELLERFIKNWNVDWKLKKGNPGGVCDVPKGG